MVKFNLLEIVDGFYRYEVLPEGDVARREFFEFNPSTRELRRNAPPKYDFDYVSKCITNLNNEDGSLKENGQVAWY
ncbi:TPA: hypothetical protein ACYSZK_000754 [Streptococcus suis]|uniref:hypothetical protein n=1 Tax=Streptococcus suis TaxID=1307 RepID=UPI001DC0109E|nr:hypothetical protein [Streptococcus suis]MDY7591321.1 hypothetical protein [Streptococcus suis]NRG58336.1 hypothetical protein [Streptococcus suis]NRH05206.1 hypothetical protein [Streptococcus suis]HEL2235831.1 hypothetical protein [Streptococcus suis]HEL2239800.1 hypothetical protein [Streptococcus suis]